MVLARPSINFHLTADSEAKVKDPSLDWKPPLPDFRWFLGLCEISFILYTTSLQMSMRYIL